MNGRVLSTLLLTLRSTLRSTLCSTLHLTLSSTLRSTLGSMLCLTLGSTFGNKCLTVLATALAETSTRPKGSFYFWSVANNQSYLCSESVWHFECGMSDPANAQRVHSLHKLNLTVVLVTHGSHLVIRNQYQDSIRKFE